MKKINIQDKEFRSFISAVKIQKAIAKMARKLNKDLKGKDVVFLGILNGSFMFMADLCRKLTIPCQISFVKLASYSNTDSTGEVYDLVGINEELNNKTVVIVEDIIDTGITIQHILSAVKAHYPAEIRIATLFFKREACQPGFEPDYLGLEVPARFIIGYGLDYNRLGRNLAEIYIES